MPGRCSQHIAGPMQAETSTVLGGGVVLRDHWREERKGPLVSDSEPTGKMSCTSSAVRVVEGEQRVQMFEDQP